MGSQNGKALLSVLVVVLIVFAVMWLAVPLLQKNSLVPNETAAIGTLRTIHQGQQDLYGATRMYGSMGRLSNSKLVSQSQDQFKSGGYEFSHSTSGRGSTWCAIATPEEGKTGRRFGIDAEGTVYEGISTTACYMGTLDKAFGSVVR